MILDKGGYKVIAMIETWLQSERDLLTSTWTGDGLRQKKCEEKVHLGRIRGGKDIKEVV